ncbi:YciI family protein [Dactylosporangium sp. AC04546]|uniref:YciI family protein n=1 Tax=Dactylosporangium sp. AC04546 TaxID=2862460 RepID=UPI001EDFC1AC|nr:YciI family protein [Dactylosporangium sp. AC04546]WVK83550.1 YciI family protein [Dactylosporangium sp. AC04546]
MPQYLLSVIEPSEGEPPAPAELEKIMADVAELDRELREAGVWVFSGGLHPPATASTLRPKGEDILVSDGPFVEGREHLGGFSIIDVPDLDAALEWARKTVVATTLPIEVRPFRW